MVLHMKLFRDCTTTDGRSIGLNYTVDKSYTLNSIGSNFVMQFKDINSWGDI